METPVDSAIRRLNNGGLGTNLSCFGSEYKMAEHFTRFTGLFHGKLLCNESLNTTKIAKKATWRTTSAIWSIYADLNSRSSPNLPDKHTLSR